MYVLLEFQPQSRQYVPQHRKNHAWKPCWNVRYQQLSKSNIERLPKQNAWIMKHFGMKPNPKKMTQDILPSFCPASHSTPCWFPCLWVSNSCCACNSSSLRRGATLSSRRCLETPKNTTTRAPVWNKRSCKLASMPAISAKNSPPELWSKNDQKKKCFCIFIYMITRLKAWCLLCFFHVAEKSITQGASFRASFWLQQLPQYTGVQGEKQGWFVFPSHLEYKHSQAPPFGII